MAFLAVFAARIGANNWEIGLLTAGPALINLVLSVPAAHWLQGRSYFRETYRAAAWHRLGYVVLLGLPWIGTAKLEVAALIGLIFGMAIPGVVLAIAFNAMYAEAVPPAARTKVINRRNAILAVSTSTTALLCGQILSRTMFPANYQIVFGLGAAGALLSSWSLGKVLPSEETHRAGGRLARDFARPGLLRFVDTIRLPVGLRFTARRPPALYELLNRRVRSPMGRFMEVYFLFYAAQYITIPLFPIYFVRVLEMNDAQISLGNALFYSTMLGASVVMGRLGTRFTHHHTLVVGALLYACYPAVNGLARDVRMYLVASLLGGIAWAVANSGLVNRLMERVPENQRSELMAVHNLVLNLGILTGAIMGPVLAEMIGLRETLWLGAGLRLGVGFLMWRWG